MSADRKSTRLNSSHTVIYTLSLHDALPILCRIPIEGRVATARSGNYFAVIVRGQQFTCSPLNVSRSEEHTSELQSHSDLHSFPTRRSSDLMPHSNRRPGRYR